jgi:hypothetical protein
MDKYLLLRTEEEENCWVQNKNRKAEYIARIELPRTEQEEN